MLFRSVKGEVNEFRAENKLKDGQSFDRNAYYLSSGIVGNITKETIIRSQKVCDWICSTLVQNDKFKKYLVGVYNKQICGNLNFISNWFNQDCQKSLAWSLGLTIGVGDYFDSKDKIAVKNLGFTHLIVVSGSQVGLVFAFFEWFTLRFRIKNGLNANSIIAEYIKARIGCNLRPRKTKAIVETNTLTEDRNTGACGPTTIIRNKIPIVQTTNRHLLFILKRKVNHSKNAKTNPT